MNKKQKEILLKKILPKAILLFLIIGAIVVFFLIKIYARLDIEDKQILKEYYHNEIE